MLQNIVRGRRETAVEYQRQFDWEGEYNWGFAFPCDEHGTINESLLAPEGRASLEACLTGAMNGRTLVDRGVQRREWSYRVPGHGTCVCGRTVMLDGDTRGEGIDCECGRIYNAVGQELAPRSQWEEPHEYQY